MPTLPERLRDFSAAVFDDAPGERAPGLEVYRRNLRANFGKVLALEFPAVEQILGSERFSDLARRFQQQSPSRNGNLHGIGRAFPAFLRAALAIDGLAWVGDVAALEWAWEESAVAGDADAALDTARLAALAPEEQLEACFVPHPALRIVRSDVPVVTLWRTHTADAAGVIAAADPRFRLSLDAGAEAAVVERPALRVEVTAVPPGEAAWLDALCGGASLGAAIDAACSVDADFDLRAALGAALLHRRFVGLHPSRER